MLGSEGVSFLDIAGWGDEVGFDFCEHAHDYFFDVRRRERYRYGGTEDRMVAGVTFWWFVEFLPFF